MYKITVIQRFHWCHGSQKKKILHLKISKHIWNQGWLAVQNSGFSQNTHLLLKGAEPVPPLKDCIQAAVSCGGMHVGKQASKKVAPLKQNITPPATDDTPLFTHLLAPRVCFTLAFLLQDGCLKLHLFKSCKEKDSVLKCRNRDVRENGQQLNLSTDFLNVILNLL